MAIRGVIVVQLEMPDVAGTSQRARTRAAAEVASEVEAYIKAKCSRPYPPESAPGTYPKRRTIGEGGFAHGVNVTGTANFFTIASAEMHGVYLEDPAGTRPNGARPWAMRALQARKWKQKFRTLSKEYTGGSRGKGRGR